MELKIRSNIGNEDKKKKKNNNPKDPCTIMSIAWATTVGNKILELLFMVLLKWELTALQGSKRQREN